MFSLGSVFVVALAFPKLTHNFPKRLWVNAKKNLACFIILSFIEFELIEGKIDPIFSIFNFIKYLINEFVGNHASHLIL